MKQLLIAILLCSGVGACASSPPAEMPVENEVATGRIVDLADVVSSGAVAPVDGITTSGQPDAAAISVFADNDYVAVIDLRGETENRGIEEREVVEAAGMNYLSFPVTSRDSINQERAAELNKLIKSQDGPVLIHCGSGNRVGAMLALIASNEGASTEEAVEAGKQGGLTTLEPVVRQRLSEEKD